MPWFDLNLFWDFYKGGKGPAKEAGSPIEVVPPRRVRGERLHRWPSTSSDEMASTAVLAASTAVEMPLFLSMKEEIAKHQQAARHHARPRHP